MNGWREGLGPWTPVLQGRQALRPRRRRRRLCDLSPRSPRCRRCSEQERRARPLRGADRGLRGVRQLRPAATTSTISPTRIGKPSLVVCLDSGCGNYDQLWLTTSLRGMAGGTLTVRVLTEGVHSGDASGHRAVALPHAARSCCRASRTRRRGEIKLPRAYVADPAAAHRAGQGRPRDVLGDEVYEQVPVRRQRRGRWPTTWPSWC